MYRRKMTGQSSREEEGKEIEEVADKLMGRLTISVDDDDFKEAAEGFENAVVAKVISEKYINKPSFVKTMCRVWRIKETDLLEMADNVFLAKLGNGEDQKKILEGGPWNFNNLLVAVRKWEAGTAAQEYKFNTCGIWVQVHNLPPYFLEGKAAEMMAGKCAKQIGRLLYFSRVEVSRRFFLRIRVEVDFEKPLCSGVPLVRGSRDPLWLSFKYEKLPFFCYNCGKLGHESKECKTTVMEDGVREFGPEMRAEYMESYRTRLPEDRRSPRRSGGEELVNGVTVPAGIKEKKSLTVFRNESKEGYAGISQGSIQSNEKDSLEGFQEINMEMNMEGVAESMAGSVEDIQRRELKGKAISKGDKATGPPENRKDGPTNVKLQGEVWVVGQARKNGVHVKKPNKTTRGRKVKKGQGSQTQTNHIQISPEPNSNLKKRSRVEEEEVSSGEGQIVAMVKRRGAVGSRLDGKEEEGAYAGEMSSKTSISAEAGLQPRREQ